MIWYLETTPDLPSHFYLLDSSKSKMYAYKKEGTKKIIQVKNEKGFLKFDARKRTFKQVK